MRRWEGGWVGAWAWAPVFSLHTTFASVHRSQHVRRSAVAWKMPRRGLCNYNNKPKQSHSHLPKIGVCQSSLGQKMLQTHPQGGILFLFVWVFFCRINTDFCGNFSVPKHTQRFVAILKLFCEFFSPQTNNRVFKGELIPQMAPEFTVSMPNLHRKPTPLSPLIFPPHLSTRVVQPSEAGKEPNPNKASVFF